MRPHSSRVTRPRSAPRRATADMLNTLTPDLPRLRADLAAQLFAESVLPSYDGRGISSIPATFLEAFGGRLKGHPPIASDILPPSFFNGVNTIVFILVDGMGLHRYRRAIEEEPNLTLASLGRDGYFGALTSVLPSTTTAALATLSTGLTPHEHGLMGYKLFLREVDEVANMIRFSPVTKNAAYPRKRFNPVTFFDHVTLYQHLLEVGVTTRVIVKAAYAHSPLSRMFYRGAEVVGHAGTHDAFVILRRMLEQRDGSPQLIYLYWDPIDNVSHYVGPDREEVAAEITGLDDALRRHVISKLKAPDVALVVTADHGHVYTVPQQRLLFNNEPDLLKMMARPPSGDSRLPYVCSKDGMAEEVRRLLAQRYRGVATVHEVDEVLSAGWFGIGEIHPEARSRIGDTVMTVAAGWKIGYRYNKDEHESIGCHGAVDTSEMMVPLVAARLG